jgi:hypothetical protein
MFKRIGPALLIAISVSIVVDVAAQAATAKCQSIQARCAVQIGGTCDPATGRWVYGRGGAGGSNKSGAFDACVSAGLKNQKK